MKNIFFILLSLVIFSCKNQGKMEMQEKQVSVDSITDATADSMNVEFEKQKVIDSMQIEMAKIENNRIETQREVIVVNNQPAANTTATTTTKKKRWSGAAKGAVIGAGVGAATGAIVSKKKVQGAIIGGLVGAGVGAGTGAIIDGKKQ